MTIRRTSEVRQDDNTSRLDAAIARATRMNEALARRDTVRVLQLKSKVLGRLAGTRGTVIRETSDSYYLKFEDGDVVEVLKSKTERPTG